MIQFLLLTTPSHFTPFVQLICGVLHALLENYHDHKTAHSYPSAFVLLQRQVVVIEKSARKRNSQRKKRNASVPASFRSLCYKRLVGTKRQ